MVISTLWKKPYPPDEVLHLDLNNQELTALPVEILGIKQAFFRVRLF
jgi:hypothetical protein